MSKIIIAKIENYIYKSRCYSRIDSDISYSKINRLHMSQTNKHVLIQLYYLCMRTLK